MSSKSNGYNSSASVNSSNYSVVSLVKKASVTNINEIDEIDELEIEKPQLSMQESKIPLPLKNEKRAYLTIELETEEIYQEIEDQENDNVNKNSNWVIQGRAFGSVFPARKLLELTTGYNENKELININPRGINKEKELLLIKDIRKGLLDNPERFYRRSNTFIVIWACVESVQYLKNKTVVNLSFTGKQGLADGQHRLSPIADLQEGAGCEANLESLRIPVSIQINTTVDDRDASEDILLTSDTNRHSWCTKAHTLGLFDSFKEIIPDEWKDDVRYYDNQPNTPNNSRCHISHILKLLAVLDKDSFNWMSKNGSHPTRFLSNSSQTYRKLIESATTTEHLLEDVVKIESYFYECAEDYLSRGKRQVLGFKSYVNDNYVCQSTLDDKIVREKKLVKLINGDIYKISAPDSIIFPVLSAFRVWLDEDLEWIKPFDTFAFKLINILWQDTIGYLNKDCSERSIKPVVMFVHDPEYWRKLCAEAYAILQERK